MPIPVPKVVEVVPVAAAPERFEYRFIGWFGPDHHRVAAFSRDGEIVTARLGERIGSRFLLRRINIESVDVETPDGVPQRVSLE